MPSRHYSDTVLKGLLAGVRTIAVVDVSPKPVRPSHDIFLYLLNAGFDVFPVNPGHAGRLIGGRQIFARLADIPAELDLVDVFMSPGVTTRVVDQALALTVKPKVIWMQPGTANEEAEATAVTAGIDVVMDRCIKVEHARLFGRRSPRR